MRVSRQFWKQHLIKALTKGSSKHSTALVVDDFLRNTPTTHMTYKEYVKAVKEALEASHSTDARERLQTAEQWPNETLEQWHKRIYDLYQEIVESRTVRGDKVSRKELFESARAQFLDKLRD